MTQLDRSRVSTTKLILSVVVDGDYYGGSSAAIPFNWESQPGTPRRFFKRSSLSGFDSDSDFNSPVSGPLTPPPSYFYTSPSSTKTPVNPKKTNTLFGSLLPKNRSSPSSPASSFTSSSSTRSHSSSVTSSPLRTSDSCSRRNRRRSMLFDSAASLDYGSNHYTNAKSSGCYASIVKMLLRDVK
ncbi:PREDICTED: putative protein TPRXL [Camelina sativa]|uniref:Uncharacterized protein n=1 Tax=Camelina sativa TaxID=90675 RepID=A0ABM0WS98_CAMSA|nr:PREDICTED: putative protein TPRXL [Camelina sativa]